MALSEFESWRVGPHDLGNVSVYDLGNVSVSCTAMGQKGHTNVWGEKYYVSMKFVVHRPKTAHHRSQESFSEPKHQILFVVYIPLFSLRRNVFLWWRRHFHGLASRSCDDFPQVLCVIFFLLFRNQPLFVLKTRLKTFINAETVVPKSLLMLTGFLY